jgi:hypothetical protein
MKSCSLTNKGKCPPPRGGKISDSAGLRLARPRQRLHLLNDDSVIGLSRRHSSRDRARRQQIIAADDHATKWQWLVVADGYANGQHDRRPGWLSPHCLCSVGVLEIDMPARRPKRSWVAWCTAARMRGDGAGSRACRRLRVHHVCYNDAPQQGRCADGTSLGGQICGCSSSSSLARHCTRAARRRAQGGPDRQTTQRPRSYTHPPHMGGV